MDNVRADNYQDIYRSITLSLGAVSFVIVSSFFIVQVV